MIELAAVIGGRVVRYPIGATFIIEERITRKRRKIIASRPTIAPALNKFHRMENGGSAVRLSYCMDGRVKKLAGV